MNWAKSFVQAPVPPKVTLSSSPFNDPYLDHMIASLAVILLPIKDRDKFLEQVNNFETNRFIVPIVSVFFIILEIIILRIAIKFEADRLEVIESILER